MSFEDNDNLGWELEDGWWEGTEPEPYVDPYVYFMGMDPGGTTGIAMIRALADDDTAKPELVYLHQIEDGRYGFKEFFGGSFIGENLTVVSEKWRERNVKGANREPQYIEGGIHMMWGEENVVWQYPDEKDVITDDYLKKNNLWTEGKPHQMDALRHVLAYLRSEGHSGMLDTLNPETESEPIAQPGEASGSELSEPSENDDGSDGEALSFDEIQEAFARLAQAATTADAQVMELAAVVAEYGDTEAPGGFVDPPEDTSKRTRRERNGAFAGYNPVEAESDSTILLDD